MNLKRATAWQSIANSDVLSLSESEKNYGSSWKKRGGVDSFMMLARKWDRLELQCKKEDWNILEATIKDGREEGLLDDIGDLRRYLLLVEAEVRQRMYDAAEKVKKENIEVTRIGDAESSYINQD